MWHEEKLLNTFFIHWATEPDFRELAISKGVDFHEFNILGNKLLSEYRNQKIKNQISDDAALQRVISIYGLPDVIDDFDRSATALIDEFLTVAKISRYRELGRKLRDEPDKGPNLIQDFLESRALGCVVKNAFEIVTESSKEYEIKKASGTECVMIPEWSRLSKIVGGFNPSRLSVLLAMTGFGKTNCAINLAVCVCQDYPVLYLNMEMSYYDIAKRLVARILERPYDDFKNENLFESAKFRFEHKKLFFSNGKDMSLEEVAAVTRRYHKEHAIRFLFVDYDQKLILKTERDEQEWKALQKAFVALESLAKELEIHVMVMAQVNRDGNISGSQRAIFPASTVLSFHQDDGKPPLISTIKNRFGVHPTHLEVEYKKEMNVISEKGFYFDVKKI